MGHRTASFIFLAAFVLLGCPGGQTSEQPPAALQWFNDVAAESGITFRHETGATGDLHLPEIVAGGAALFDYDGDGDLDVYLTSGNALIPRAEAGGETPNRLYRQEADGRFVDVTDASGLGDRGYGMGVAVGDVDNDGDDDVLVTNFGPDRLYRNLGDGTFEDVTREAGIPDSGLSVSAAFFDYDRDGWLDLYVVQYILYDPDRRCFDPAGRKDYCGPKVFRPVPDILLHNDGDGTFTDVSESAGIASEAAAGLGVVCVDFDEDGLIDVYVANDGYANHLWKNVGDGTFLETAMIAGAAYNLHGKPEAGMGVVGADLDGDARPDLFVTHLSGESNTYYRNLGGGAGFGDSTGQSQLGASSMAFTGFGVVAMDIELDGEKDLLIANGRVTRTEPRPDASVEPPWAFFAEPNLLFVNRGDATFESIAERGFCEPVEISRGLAIGDVDRDGDLDVLVSNVQGPARLYRNDAPRRGHWLSVAAVDPALRRPAIGAWIVVHAGERRFAGSLTRAFSYLSSSEPRVHFGLGPVERVERIEVVWPDGLRETFGGTAVDTAVDLVRGTGEPAP